MECNYRNYSNQLQKSNPPANTNTNNHSYNYNYNNTQMSQKPLSKQNLQSALSDNKSYSSTQPFLNAIQNLPSFALTQDSDSDPPPQFVSLLQVVNQVFSQILSSMEISLMSKLLVLRMYKDIFMIGNMDFFDNIDPTVQQSIISAAAYNPKFKSKGKNDKQTRGGMYFVQMEKRTKNNQNIQLGNSFVLFATQIIKYFAQWLPEYPEKNQSRFLQAFQQLQALGVSFNTNIYFQPEEQKKFHKNFQQWKDKSQNKGEQKQKQQKQQAQTKKKPNPKKQEKQNQNYKQKQKQGKQQKCPEQQKAKIKNLQSKLQKSQEQLVKKQQEINNLKEQLELAGSSAANLEKEQLKILEKQKIIQLLTKQNNEHKETIKQYEVKLQQADGKIIILEKDIVKLKEQNARIVNSKKRIQEDVKQGDKQKDRVCQIRDDAMQKISNLQQIVSQLKAQNIQYKQQLQSSQQKKKQLQTKLQQVQLQSTKQKSQGQAQAQAQSEQQSEGSRSLALKYKKMLEKQRKQNQLYRAEVDNKAKQYEKNNQKHDQKRQEENNKIEQLQKQKNEWIAKYKRIKQKQQTASPQIQKQKQNQKDNLSQIKQLNYELEQKVLKYKQKLKLSKNQFEKLNQTVQTLTDQNQKLRSSNKVLKEQIDKLKQVINTNQNTKTKQNSIIINKQKQQHQQQQINQKYQYKITSPPTNSNNSNINSNSNTNNKADSIKQQQFILQDEDSKPNPTNISAQNNADNKNIGEGVTYTYTCGKNGQDEKQNNGGYQTCNYNQIYTHHNANGNTNKNGNGNNEMVDDRSRKSVQGTNWKHKQLSMSLSKYLTQQPNTSTINNNANTLTHKRSKNSLHKTESSKWRNQANHNHYNYNHNSNKQMASTGHEGFYRQFREMSNTVHQQFNSTFHVQSHHNQHHHNSKNDRNMFSNVLCNNDNVVTTVFPFIQAYFSPILIEQTQHFRACCISQFARNTPFYSNDKFQLYLHSSKIQDAARKQKQSDFSPKFRLLIKNLQPEDMHVKIYSQTDQVVIRPITNSGHGRNSYITVYSSGYVKVCAFSQYIYQIDATITNINFRYPIITLSTSPTSKHVDCQFRIPLPLTLFSLTKMRKLPKNSSSPFPSPKSGSLCSIRRHRSQRLPPVESNMHLRSLDSVFPELKDCINYGNGNIGVRLQYEHMDGILVNMYIMQYPNGVQFITQYMSQSKMSQAFSKVILQAIMFSFI